MEALERTVWREVDVVMYPSNAETAIVTDTEPGVVARTLVPYSFADFASPRPPIVEPIILFVGGFADLPNCHGAIWFVEQVLPLIRARGTGRTAHHRRFEPLSGRGGVGRRSGYPACQR